MSSADGVTPVRRVAALVVAESTYDPVYDEVLDEVVDRIRAAGSAGKLDIGALTAWKRLRADTPWMSKLMAMPDAAVRERTGLAVELANEPGVGAVEAGVRACRALEDLPGFRSGGALATTVCLAAAPRRLAVMDRRAIAGLRAVGLPLPHRPDHARVPLYRSYLELVEQCRRELADHGHTWTARQVDTALFRLGGPVAGDVRVRGGAEPPRRDVP